MADTQNGGPPDAVAVDGDGNEVDREVVVAGLVAGGVSRLTAERIVAIERGDEEPGRARRHSQARR